MVTTQPDVECVRPCGYASEACRDVGKGMTREFDGIRRRRGLPEPGIFTAGGRHHHSSLISWERAAVGASDQTDNTEGSFRPNHSFDYLKELGSCPPPGAKPQEGEYYACHSSNPPTATDFRTAAERGVHPQGDECKRRGNSILADLEDAKSLTKRHPLVFKHVSKGNITRDAGVLLHTQSRGAKSHHTFWVCDGVKMHDLFTKVVE